MKVITTYDPSDEEKDKISKVCDKVIDDMSELTIAQKSFALFKLCQSFTDITGIKIIGEMEKEQPK